jgi:hypothetical protein
MSRRRLGVIALSGAVAFAVVLGVVRPWNGRSAASHAKELRLELVDKMRHGEEAEQQREGRDEEQATRAAAPSGLHFRAPTAAVTAHAASAATDIGFGQPTISGIGGTGFEQDLRSDPDNGKLLYTSVPGALSSDTSWIWRSTDGGATFKWIPAAAPQTGKAIACAGGGDTELAVAAGKLYFNDLTLANFSIGRSDDGGTTFPCNNTGVPDAGVDRQWYAADGDPTNGGSLYLANDEVGNGGPNCNGSIGNNTLVMYRSPVAGAGPSAGLQFGPANKVTAVGSCDEGIMGNDEVSPVATRTGHGGGANELAKAVRHVYVIHDDATLSKIAIGRCFPVAFGPPVPNVSDPSGLDCVDLPVANLGDPSQVRTGGNFPSLAIDHRGNLYAVWEQAPIANGHVGDSSLMYSYSTDEGSHWSAPVQIPTAGLANNVFAWAAAGDDGKVDVAWYGTSASADPSNPDCSDGPDSVDGLWSLYLTQTLNGHDATGVTFSPPALASEHYVHKGNIQTVLGGQCGDRTLGDFLQVRIGPKGEARISYADSNNIDEPFAPHAMYVAQASGPGVLGKTLSGKRRSDHASDASGDAVYEAGGATSANMPNLDLVSSSLSVPAASRCRPKGTPCVRVKLKVANLTLDPPAAPDSDTTEVWQTQWLVPASPSCSPSDAACANGGRNPMVYAESNSGGAITCWVGENAAQALGGGVTLTYPGARQLAADACRVSLGSPGTITIDVPLADATLGSVPALDSKLYSVTATTMTLPAPAESVPSLSGLGGVLFDLIDVVKGYDFDTGS